MATGIALCTVAVEDSPGGRAFASIAAKNTKTTMNQISYQTNLTNLNIDSLNGEFFENWPSKPNPATHLNLLKKSLYFVVAIDQESKKVVGFITAISDEVLATYIPFLEVLPEYRKRGIASHLVKILFEQLSNHYMIDLCCDPELIPFYKKFGMSGGNAMIIRNYDRQSGI